MAIFWVLYILRQVLIPFAIALILAYLINPFTHFVQRLLRIKKRWLGLFVSFLLLLIVMLIGIRILSPLISKEVSHMAGILEKYASEQDLSGRIEQILPESIADNVVEILRREEARNLFQNLDWPSILSKVSDSITGIFSGSMWLLGGIVSIFLVAMYLFFILLDYDEISGKWREWLPSRYSKTVAMVFEDLELSMNKYFRAQITIALIIGVLFAVGFSIISLPLGILFGIVVGLMNIVPYLQTLAIVPASFLGLIHSLETGQSFWWVFGAIVLIFVIIQIIQEAILIPKIMGDVTGLNPAIILLSLSIWGKLLGLLGLILALPVTSILISYYQRFLLRVKETGAEE